MSLRDTFDDLYLQVYGFQPDGTVVNSIDSMTEVELAEEIVILCEMKEEYTITEGERYEYQPCI